MPERLDVEQRHFLVDTFLGGLNSFFPPHKVPDNSVVKAQNALILENGVVTRRPGLTQLGTNITVFTNRDRAYFLLAAGYGDQHKVYAILGRSSTQQATASAWDGTSWREPAVAAKGIDEVTAAWVSESDAEYVVVSGGHTLTHSNALRILIVDSGVTPSSDAATQVPTGTRYLVTAGDRLWAGGRQRETSTSTFTADIRALLYWGEPYPNMNTFNEALTNLIGTNAGQAITGMAPYRSEFLFVGMESSCYLVDMGNHPNLFDQRITTVSADIGCGSNRTIANVGEDLFFMDQHGAIRSLNVLLAEQGAAVRRSAVSLPIQDVLGQPDKELMFRSCAAFHKGNYWLSFKQSGVAQHKHFTYNVERQVWTGPHIFKEGSGNQLSIMAMGVGAGSPGGADFEERGAHLYFLCDTSLADAAKFQVFELDDSVVKDDGSTIDMEVITKAHDMGFPHQEKVFDWVELTWKKVSGTTGGFTLEARTDFGDWYHVMTIDYTEGKEVNWMKAGLDAVTGRTIQFRIKCSDLNTQPEIVSLVVQMRGKEIRGAG